jgi:hypothetical protein
MERYSRSGNVFHCPSVSLSLVSHIIPFNAPISQLSILLVAGVHLPFPCLDWWGDYIPQPPVDPSFPDCHNPHLMDLLPFFTIRRPPNQRPIITVKNIAPWEDSWLTEINKQNQVIYCREKRQADKGRFVPLPFTTEPCTAIAVPASWIRGGWCSILTEIAAGAFALVHSDRKLKS